MEKRKTISIIIFSLLLAALVAAAAVLGTALSRSAYSDTDTGEAGEARWRVVAGEAVVGGGEAGGMRPSAEEYDSEEGARVRHSLVPVGTVENLGDVKASVSVTAGDITPVVTGDAYDIDEYTGDEIMEHFGCVFYWSYDSGHASADEDGVYGFSEGGAYLDPGDAGTGSSAMYLYLDVAWTSDLDIDVNEEDYDGAAGDLFDSWASRHLECLAFTMTIEAEQAE